MWGGALRNRPPPWASTPVTPYSPCYPCGAQPYSPKRILLQTRRYERPRSSRDHHSNPTDVLYRFSASMEPRSMGPPRPLGDASWVPLGTPGHPLHPADPPDSWVTVRRLTDPQHPIHKKIALRANFVRSGKMLEKWPWPNLDAMSVPEALVYSILHHFAQGIRIKHP